MIVKSVILSLLCVKVLLYICKPLCNPPFKVVCELNVVSVVSVATAFSVIYWCIAAALSIPSFLCVDMEWVERSKYKLFEMEMSVALTELFNHF